MFHVPGKYNGGEGPGYAWTQTQSEVELRAPLPAGAEGSVRCTFSARTLVLSWADAAAPLDAALSALVAPDDCLWSIEEDAGAKTVVVSLRKQVKAVWSRLLESDAEPTEAPRLIDGAERATPKSKAELLADAKARAKGTLNEELGKAKLHMIEGRSGEVRPTPYALRPTPHAPRRTPHAARPTPHAAQGPAPPCPRAQTHIAAAAVPRRRRRRPSPPPSRPRPRPSACHAPPPRMQAWLRLAGQLRAFPAAARGPCLGQPVAAVATHLAHRLRARGGAPQLAKMAS